MLRPQDVVVAVQLRSDALQGRPRSTYAGLGLATGLSASQCHGAVGRLEAAGLSLRNSAGADSVPLEPLGRLLLQAVPLWLYPEHQGSPGAVRGVPTAWSATPLSGVVVSQRVVVWPHAQGVEAGDGLAPVHACILRGPCVPGEPRYNPRLHQILALVDAVRLGRPRDRREAAALLKGLGYCP